MKIFILATVAFVLPVIIARVCEKKFHPEQDSQFMGYGFMYIGCWLWVIYGILTSHGQIP